MPRGRPVGRRDSAPRQRRARSAEEQASRDRLRQLENQERTRRLIKLPLPNIGYDDTLHTEGMMVS